MSQLEGVEIVHEAYWKALKRWGSPVRLDRQMIVVMDTLRKFREKYWHRIGNNTFQWTINGPHQGFRGDL